MQKSVGTLMCVVLLSLMLFHSLANDNEAIDDKNDEKNDHETHSLHQYGGDEPYGGEGGPYGGGRGPYGRGRGPYGRGRRGCTYSCCYYYDNRCYRCCSVQEHQRESAALTSSSISADP
eukprot:TRINITY_DN24015_c0_g1_i1.p1 TRINITY_DN24015_c0_g1~~TRINITY_DN24015_c0_g1_i1.p1  ORF type:complete len:119 (+),score=3.20 TRINITY_DN24015_c0_g1_i1:78-434(+)